MIDLPRIKTPPPITLDEIRDRIREGGWHVHRPPAGGGLVTLREADELQIVTPDAERSLGAVEAIIPPYDRWPRRGLLVANLALRAHPLEDPRWVRFRRRNSAPGGRPWLQGGEVALLFPGDGCPVRLPNFRCRVERLEKVAPRVLAFDWGRARPTGRPRR